jgi:leucyl/phenylalanyl-tRNA--protein transferase
MSYWLLSDIPVFPHPLAVSETGILAVGGDLSYARLTLAYQYGIYPWYNEGDPIVWWFPDPRCVLNPADIVISKSMSGLIRKNTFSATCDKAFAEVITRCRTIPRDGQKGTWIQPEMVEAYLNMHEAGDAHSVEVWQEGELVGGLYGVAMGRIFFGESMFSQVSNASKYALIALARLVLEKQFWLIDCQQDTRHMRSMGASVVSATQFHALLQRNRLLCGKPEPWESKHIELHL